MRPDPKSAKRQIIWLSFCAFVICASKNCWWNWPQVAGWIKIDLCAVVLVSNPSTKNYLKERDIFCTISEIFERKPTKDSSQWELNCEDLLSSPNFIWSFYSCQQSTLSPLNVITLAHIIFDNIKQVIIRNGDFFSVIFIVNGMFEMWSHLAADNINQWLHY